MRIRSVELVNFRKFAGTVRVDGIGDGVNVLVGRNELGKSTLLQAINGVIFERAKSTSQHVRSFRHFVNETVPEVKLSFEVDGVGWTIHKRFAGGAGKATLTCDDSRVFENEAAEAELQRLLGFAGGRSGGEPGIWGTLWVEQGRSFGDAKPDEQARQTLQGCLEAQVGAVTGGARGHRIPKAVKQALDLIQSSRGPRGPYRDAVERLAEAEAKCNDLAAKRAEVFRHMEELARHRRELAGLRRDWNEDDHRREIEAERVRHTEAATRATQIDKARSEAKAALDRAERARQAVAQRATLASEIAEVSGQIDVAKAELAMAQDAHDGAQKRVTAAEAALAGLRQDVARGGETGRRLARVRDVLSVAAEIEEHEATLARAAALDAEAGRLAEAIGRIAATDEAVARIEQADTALARAEAALGAVATTVALAIDEAALARVAVDGERLRERNATLTAIDKTVIAIEGIGTIAVEPRIGDRAALLARQEQARSELKAALEAAGTEDLAAARTAAAQRKEHERRFANVRRDLAGLAPGNKARRIAAGLDALRSHVGLLRGRLQAETGKLGLAGLPDAAELAAAVAANHAEADALAQKVAAAEAALGAPKELLTRAAAALNTLQRRMAGLDATRATKAAALGAGRAVRTDEQLAAEVQTVEAEAAEKSRALQTLEHSQGEGVEAIAARIKRLEGAAANHRKAVVDHGNEITRFAALIEASEGAGVEEQLDAAEAEKARLEAVVAEFAQETAVLRLLSDTLDGAEREAKNRYLAPVIGRVEPYLRMLLPGVRLVLDENFCITGIERDGRQEEFEHLSDGTREQLAILTRIAFAELLRGQGRPATVILDDALAFSDDQRIETMFDILMRAGEQVQIIVLTCRRRLFTRLGAAPLQIEGEGA